MTTSTPDTTSWEPLLHCFVPTHRATNQHILHGSSTCIHFLSKYVAGPDLALVYVLFFLPTCIPFIMFAWTFCREESLSAERSAVKTPNYWRKCVFNNCTITQRFQITVVTVTLF